MTTGQRRVRHQRLWFYQWWVRTSDGPTYTLDAGGGCAAFRRANFVALGGFDRLYHPAYFEDIDLSYRAWQRGWRTVYEPTSVIYHRVGATLTPTAKESATRRLLARNHALCALKNLGGWGTALGVLALIPVRAVKAWARGDGDGARGLVAALPRSPRALLRRIRRTSPRLTGEQIDAGVAAPVQSGRPSIITAAAVSFTVAG